MNKNVERVTRNRLEMQGFTGLDWDTLRQIRGWLRVGPAICATMVAAGLLFGSPLLIGGTVVFAALGAVLPMHPLDVPYNLVIRRWTGGPRIPSYGRPRRFSCGMAAAVALVAGLALASGYTILAFVFGVAFVVPVAVNVTTDFCPGSFIYQQACSRRGASCERHSSGAARHLLP